MAEFDDGYAVLLGLEDPEDPGQGDEEEDAGGGAVATDEFGAKWGWVDAVRRVSETTNESWSAVWKMTITEFLNICSYIQDLDEYNKRMMEEWKRKN